MAIARIINGLHGLFLGHPVKKRKDIFRANIAYLENNV
jgi:hypothetical protein